MSGGGRGINARPAVLAARLIPAPGRKYQLTFKVEGGLHFITSNRIPYFSLTMTSHRDGFPNQDYSGGCNHEEILEYYPKFADLAALHLCDMNGKPMHGEANGWYDLAGFLPGNAGQRYHVGNSDRHFPKPAGAPSRGSWDTTDYRKPTPAECLAIFAREVRISPEEAEKLAIRIIDIWTNTRAACESAEQASVLPTSIQAQQAAVPINWTSKSWAKAREYYRGWIAGQEPRWKAEADACIAKHGLRVYGDPWPAPEEPAQ